MSSSADPANRTGDPLLDGLDHFTSEEIEAAVAVMRQAEAPLTSMAMERALQAAWNATGRWERAIRLIHELLDVAAEEQNKIASLREEVAALERDRWELSKQEQFEDSVARFLDFLEESGWGQGLDAYYGVKRYLDSRD